MNCRNCIYGQDTGHEECKTCVGNNYKSNVHNTEIMKLQEQLEIVSNALLSIVEYECCNYGQDKAVAIAEAVIENK